MADSLETLIHVASLTEVVDIGANPIDTAPPYRTMLSRGICRVTGFEPQTDALAKLESAKGPNERYLPYAVGDGEFHTLHVATAPGMTSLLAPDPARLEVFGLFKSFGTIKREERIATRRLDDIEEISRIDFLKIDVQGSEGIIFANGQRKLAGAIGIQTEVSFVTLYCGQPSFGDIDIALRNMGFIPHCFVETKIWPIAPAVFHKNQRVGLRQILEADIFYVRDYTKPDALSSEQIKHLALVAHYCYGSIDLAMRCLRILTDRKQVDAGALAAYVQLANRILARQRSRQTNSA